MRISTIAPSPGQALQRRAQQRHRVVAARLAVTRGRRPAAHVAEQLLAGSSAASSPNCGCGSSSERKRQRRVVSLDVAPLRRPVRPDHARCRNRGTRRSSSRVDELRPRIGPDREQRARPRHAARLGIEASHVEPVQRLRHGHQIHRCGGQTRCARRAPPSTARADAAWPRRSVRRATSVACTRWKCSASAHARLAAAAAAVPDRVACAARAREPREQFRWIAGAEVRVLARDRRRTRRRWTCRLFTPAGTYERRPAL